MAMWHGQLITRPVLLLHTKLWLCGKLHTERTSKSSFVQHVAVSTAVDR